MTDSSANPYSQYQFIAARQRCWACDDRRAKTDIGLCGECRDRLIEEGRGGEK